MSNNNAVDQMLEMFLFESNSLLEQLDEILLNSEKRGSLTEDDVNEIFRIMHTIKGSSAMMEFGAISALTHRLEDTFYVIRENGIAPEHFTELFDLILDATDFVKSQLHAIETGEPAAEGNDELISRVAAFLAAISGKPSEGGKPSGKEPEAKAEAEAGGGEEAASPGGQPPPGEGDGGAYRVNVVFEEDCGMENLRAFMLLNTLRGQCSILSYEPADIETNPETAAVIANNGFVVDLRAGLGRQELQDIVDGAAYVHYATISSFDGQPPDQAAAPEAGPAGEGECYDVTVRFEEGCGMENLRAFMLLGTLRARCRILRFFPEDIERNPKSADEIVRDGFSISLRTDLTRGALQELLDGGMHVASAYIAHRANTGAAPAEPEPKAKKAAKPKEPPPAASQPEKAAEPAAGARPPAAAAPGKPVRQNLINVSLSKLDELMDLMGEIVITESMVTRNPDLRDVPKLDNFHKAARQLRKLTDELQDLVMSVRMVPVAGTFQKMQRIVRDMCRALGKDVDLITMGEETDIDKTIIDGIADPIMHLVRNSMDHGVETPEERVAAGKPPKAAITLSAQNTGGEILITVSDDGRGLDAEKILEKARKNGILTKPAGEYSEREIYMLLTMPGFSTKEQVTEFSGRGVGMDVVKKNIEKIGGTVTIESKKGHGMGVFLKIPLTLAIVDGMEVSVGGCAYTLQITAINESFKVSRDQVIVDTDGNEMIMIRGDCYPIVRLHELYGIPDAVTDIGEGILILVQGGDESVCLFVDELVGEQQIVVKPLPVYLNRYNVKSCGISGCTILGDGNISLILDMENLIEKAMGKR